MRFATPPRLGLALLIALSATGCASVEGGFRYEYDGHIYRADGKTPVKTAAVRLARPDAPEAPDLPEKMAKSAVKYVDKAQKLKTDRDGRYVGVLETVQGWKYTQFMGMHTGGPTRAPEPPALDEVILYVQEKGHAWTGYRLKLPPESQADAMSGIRKIHVPDVLLPEPATTQPTTAPTTAP